MTTGARRLRWALHLRPLVLVLAALSPAAAVAADAPATRSAAAVATSAARYRHAAVVCVSQPAAQVGLAALQNGGTAVDAAVATAFALAVTYPRAGNIGGGGYLLVVPDQSAADGAVFDFRETAPAAATREMFVDPQARTPHRRVGVPGTVRGLALAHQRFGKRPWRELVLPAVALAREGFALDAAVARQLNDVLAKNDRATFAELHRVYGRPDGKPWQAGDQLRQPELANVLLRIAERGADGFYTGATAQLVAAEMQHGGGLVTAADLAAYRPIERRPLVGTYRGCEIVAVPPSSSGGTTLVEMLNILEHFELRPRGRWSPDVLHLLVESMKRGYRDRACYLADPAFTDIPPKLLDKAYARKLAAAIDRRRATPSDTLAGAIAIAPESEHTTHLSVVDSQRMAVALTYTLESSFGSRVVVRGGGFLLNDEMNDFNWLPGVTTRDGRIGTPPNQVAPGKRMLSSMCPTIVRRDGHTLLVTGSPGGRTIINTVLQVVLNVVEFEMDVCPAVEAPRLHHQWLPDRVRVEAALAERHAPAIEGLRAMGHEVTTSTTEQGDAHTILIDPQSGELVAAPDTRISGSAAGY
jgi:gamma-glutamyltranspeptidase/glutathione hydrolase